MAEIKLRDVRKSFGKVEVIKGVNIEIEDGEFVVIVGPSGCGKSTLLRMIAGLEDITQGTLEIDGVRMNDRQPKDRGIAMVFQPYAFFPHMTVRENVAFGLTINKIDKETRDAKVDEAARILQMENLLDRRPSELSGVSANVWRLAVQLFAILRFFCLTNLCRTLMHPCAWTCVWKLESCTSL